jgi:hypothetical protein
MFKELWGDIISYFTECHISNTVAQQQHIAIYDEYTSRTLKYEKDRLGFLCILLELTEFVSRSDVITT